MDWQYGGVVAWWGRDSGRVVVVVWWRGVVAWWWYGGVVPWCRGAVVVCGKLISLLGRDSSSAGWLGNPASPDRVCRGETPQGYAGAVLHSCLGATWC